MRRRRLLVAVMVVGIGAAVAVALPQASPGGQVLFDGGFKRGLTAWDTVIHRERVAVVPDPVLGRRRTVAKLTVLDGDTGPTPNPRAQVESPPILTAGKTFWVGWSTLFPRSFPVLPPGGWLTFEEIYGPPFRGAGPLATRVAGNDVRFERLVGRRVDVPWSHPIQRGRWMDFVYHVKLSKDPRVGYVELFLNTGRGWVRQRLAGQQRLHMRTLDGSNGGGANNFRVTNYRKRGMFASVTLYQASPKVGTSLAAVAPRSYPSGE